MSRKEKNGSGKMKLALIGLALILFADIVSDLAMFIGDFNVVNWAEAGVTAVAWIMIIVAFATMRHKRKEFARGFIVSIIGFLAIIGHMGFVFLNVRAEIGVNPFSPMKPMFCEYFSDLMMLLVFYLLVRGCGQLIARGGDMKLAQLSIKKSNTEPIIALLAMLLTTFGSIFNMPLSIIIGAVGIVVNAAMRVDMMNYIKTGMKNEF